MAKISQFMSLLLTFSLSEAAFCQEIPNAQLTFEFFLDAVATQHPEHALDAMTLDRSRMAIGRAGLLADPQINIGRDEVPFQNRVQKNLDMAKEEKNTAQWKVGLTQSFPWPGTLSAEERVAQSSSVLTETANDVSTFNRRLEAATLFLQLVRTQKLLKLEQENLRVVEGIRDLTHEQFRQGVGSHYEFLQAHSESGILRINVASLETDLLNLKMHALYLINHSFAARPAEVNFSLEWPKSLLNPPSAPNASKPHDYVHMQIEQRKDNVLARQDFEYRRSLPSFMASGEFMEEDSGMRMYAAMIGISIPIFSNIKRNSLSLENRVIQNQAEQALGWQNRRKELALLQVERRIAQMSANLNALEKDIIPPIKEHIEATTVQFSQGKIDIGAIINARRTLLNLEVSEVRMTEQLLMSRLSLEKIQAGVVDGELDREVPQLIGTGSTMNGSGTSSDSMKAMGRERKPMTQDNLPKPLMKDNPGESDDELKNTTPGMGM